jgi:metal-dependent hydrolase (beta-lactamase superfamily II)
MINELYILPAEHGDCLLIRYSGTDGAVHNILIDGGTRSSFNSCLKPQLELIKRRGEYLDLVVLTHVDNDHIGGLLELVANHPEYYTLIKEFWLNSYRIGREKYSAEVFPSYSLKVDVRRNTNQPKDLGPKEVVELEDLLVKLGIRTNLEPILAGYEKHLHGVKLTILNPTEELYKKFLNTAPEPVLSVNLSASMEDHLSIEELAHENPGVDNSVHNRSSIVVLVELAKSSFLLLADSNPTDVASQVRQLFGQLDVDYVKVSHHGSKANTNLELLEVVSTSNYIFSTNGRGNNPSKIALAKILTSNANRGLGVNIYSNYPLRRRMLTNEEVMRYNVTISEGAGNGILISTQ